MSGDVDPDQPVEPAGRYPGRHDVDVMVVADGGPMEYYIRCVFCGYESEESSPDLAEANELAMDHFVAVREPVNGPGEQPDSPADAEAETGKRRA